MPHTCVHCQQSWGNRKLKCECGCSNGWDKVRLRDGTDLPASEYYAAHPGQRP